MCVCGVRREDSTLVGGRGGDRQSSTWMGLGEERKRKERKEGGREEKKEGSIVREIKYTRKGRKEHPKQKRKFWWGGERGGKKDASTKKGSQLR